MFQLGLSGAGNEVRTRDPDLGKVVLYQLSYSRLNAIPATVSYSLIAGANIKTFSYSQNEKISKYANLLICKYANRLNG